MFLVKHFETKKSHAKIFHNDGTIKLNPFGLEVLF